MNTIQFYRALPQSSTNTADGTESEAKILRCHDSNNREAGFPVFYRCFAPDLPIGDGFAGHDEERGLGTGAKFV
jgi:hypothetical protein